MFTLLEQYRDIVGSDVIDHLRQLATPLAGKTVIHVNSTRYGGGVAEILYRLVPLMQNLEMDASWEVINGTPEFYQCTKSFHNALQGKSIKVPDHLLRAYEEVNRQNAELLRAKLEAADIVFIHDPQPAPLLKYCANRKGKWIWRCHIDVSRPYRPVWNYLRQFVAPFDASVWSLATFAQPLPHVQYLIAPSIDPLAEKNMPLDQEEVSSICTRFGIDCSRPMVVQVSRFDVFKDPLGVIDAYKLAKLSVPGLQLVLAGSGASDDPEGEVVLKDVLDAAKGDEDIHVLLLPPDTHRTINALQRAADVVMQKSVREGFGLTVTEALWKGKPVIGGNTGGIRLQVIDHHTGFLVRTPQGAALRLRYLLDNRDRLRAMGEKGRRFVQENFLLTRQLSEYLTMMVAVIHNFEERIELG
ncbi:MAG TPA: glycosyltransferase [bacterium]|jgi:trehalose synthase